MRLRLKKTRGAIFNIVMCVFIVISILITKFGLSDKYPESMALVWGVVITIWLFTLAFSYMHYKYEIVFFSISYIINLLYHCYLIKGNSLQNPDLSGDASGFWQVANQYYEGFFNRVYTKLPYIINAEFHVFGVNYFCCILINIAMSMITIIITTNVLRKLSLSRTTRLFLTLLIGLFPFSFIMSTSLWREPIYLLCLTASFAIFCDYVVSNNKVLFYVALILLMPVLFMHIGYFPIIVVYFYMFFVIQKIKTKKEFIKMLLQIVVLFIVCVVVMGFDSISYIVGKGSGGIEGMMEALIDDGTVSTGGSAYLTNIQANTLGKVIIYAPLKWFYYSFSPLMSNWRGISDISFER